MDQIFKEFGNTIAGIFSSEIVQLVFRGIGIYIVILWLATAFWAYQDMKSRTTNPILPFLAAALIVAFTPILFIFAAIVYRIIRPHERVGEAHERMLAEEAMLAEVEQLDHCTGCGRRIAEGWMVCPTCRTRLRRVCPSCGKLVGADWIVCAWCGVDFERQAGRPAAAAVGAGASRAARPQPRQVAPAPAAAPAAAQAPAASPAPARVPAYEPQAYPREAAVDVAGWPVAEPVVAQAASDRVAAQRPSPVAAAEPAPTLAQATRMDPAPASPRPTPVPPPSPFRSISDGLDEEGLGSLVTEPGPMTATTEVHADDVPAVVPAPAPAPARVSGRRASGR